MAKIRLTPKGQRPDAIRIQHPQNKKETFFIPPPKILARTKNRIGRERGA